MGTGIEWTDETWNPVHGCSKVSAGCTNCYAEKVSHRFGFTSKPWNATYAAENVQLHPERLDHPLRWKRPRRIFVNSMSDLFHQQVPFEFIREVFAVMFTSRQHIFQILTKRPTRMLEFMQWYQDRLDKEFGGHVRLPFQNVWLGVSVENQQAADERIPLLLQTPAAVRFLSCEPLLGPVNLTKYGHVHCRSCYDDPGSSEGSPFLVCEETNRIDWVIAGGESGSKARPMHTDWVRSLRDQCADRDVAFFFKQWGEWHPLEGTGAKEPTPIKFWRTWEEEWVSGVSSGGYQHVVRIGKKRSGRVLDGRTWDEMPVIES